MLAVSRRDVSDIGGVEWDAVELPSQFMEISAGVDVLKHDSPCRHQPALPRALFEKMLCEKTPKRHAACADRIFSLFDACCAHQPQ
jgi:oligopeptidase A